MFEKNTLAALLAALTITTGACTSAARDTPPPTKITPAKGYVVAEINVTDMEGYRDYVAAAAPVIQQFGGKFLTRGGETVPVEGARPAQRVMIIEFESFERAKMFEYSKAYTDIAPLRKRTSESRIFLIEGTADATKSAP